MKKSVLSRIVKPSTMAFLQEARSNPETSFFDMVHGMIYARFPYLYIGIGVGEHPIAKRFGPFYQRLVRSFQSLSSMKHSFKNQVHGQKPHSELREKITFADTYHGKVVPTEQARQLVIIQEDIRLPNLEPVIPYKRARDIILKNPDHIAVLECPCRSSRSHPCLPLDVCLIVGEPFASYVVEHQPEKARWITQEEAVGILQAENERGHVHHAFFKDAMLNRFYAICNCCACCCGAMQAHRSGTPMLASSGFLAMVAEDLCIGCETCMDFCQFGALTLNDFVSTVDKDACMGCGVCVDHCDQEAISLEAAPERGIPLEICELMASVAEG